MKSLLYAKNKKSYKKVTSCSSNAYSKSTPDMELDLDIRLSGEEHVTFLHTKNKTCEIDRFYVLFLGKK